MLSMYVAMHLAFSNDGAPSTKPKPSNPPELTNADQTSVYVEIYFSTQAQNFSLTHPATGRTIIKEQNLNASEWSGEVSIPVKKLTSEEIEIQCEAKWSSTKDDYKFIQVIISPDDLDPQSQTLRAEGDITDIMKFHWEEDQ